MFKRRINIFTGHFGSGKTEVAVNYAIEMKKRYEKTAIIDMDIINPYFRMADVKAFMESQGIWVVVPMYANTNIDVPAMPSEISSIFAKKEYSAVFDVGGDDLGARALSRYRDDIISDDYAVFFVINTRRPMTDTTDKILEMIRSIEQSARLEVTYLVNNTNLLEATSVEDILIGHEMIKEVSVKLQKPMIFTAATEKNAVVIEKKVEEKVLHLQHFIRLPWQ